MPYFHLVFTLPHELSAWCWATRQRFRICCCRRVADAGGTRRRSRTSRRALGVWPSCTPGASNSSIIHVHMIVPGGGPSMDGSRWIASRPNFLLPVKVLGKLFRGKFLAELRQAYVTGQLSFDGSTASLVAPRAPSMRC